PDVRYSRTNGFELATPYYFQLAPNRDLTLTPHVYTEVLPAIEAQYRELTSLGAYSIGGIITYSERQPATLLPDTSTTGNKDVRGYFEANGRFQLDPVWSISGSARVTTDKTFLRRYDISRDDRLRSTFNLERIDTNSYFSIAGWAVQGLRPQDSG